MNTRCMLAPLNEEPSSLAPLKAPRISPIDWFFSSADRSAPSNLALVALAFVKSAATCAPGEVGAVELAAAELRGEQAGVLQVGAGEVRFQRPGLIEDDALEVGVGEVRIIETGRLQLGAAQVHARQVEAVEALAA